MTAYRQSTPSCPTCHEPLTAHSVADPAAVVDLCAKCGGVWIDWEDGDFTEIAREVPPSPVREMPRAGPGSCPRCNRPLVVEVFLDTAEVLRCTECAGAFLPYPSIGKIAASTPAEARAEQREGAHESEERAPEDAPSPDGAASPDEMASLGDREGTWGRVVRAIRGWVR